MADQALPEKNARSRAKWLGARYRHVLDHFIPDSLRVDPETYRLSLLQMGFAVLGLVFGSSFSLLYFLIGHPVGAYIVLGCTIALLLIPLLLLPRERIRMSGNLQAAVFCAGFTLLGLTEGGMRGHSIAWLCSAPIIALLLVGYRDALIWFALTLAALVGLAVMELAGIEVPNYIPVDWISFTTVLGTVALALFLFILGLLLENGRRRAQLRLEKTMGDLQELNSRLELLNAEKDEFLSIAAHDLRNPLTTITMGAEMVEEMTDESLHPITSSILFESRRMERLINDLLDINAIEAGKFNFQFQPMDALQQTRDRVESFRSRAERKNQRLEMETMLGEVSPPFVGDDRALAQVLDNLISNALKFSASSTLVRVILRQIEDHPSPGTVLEWTVQDEGPGLTPADQEKLFQRFAKLSARPTGDESSTGLGLSIVKRLIEAQGGSISCKSQPGQGTAFIVTLPSKEN